MITTEETEAAFTALADSTRIDILRTLWEREDGAASFTELREALGMSDSGQFNYHLDQLTGRFVSKAEDGYSLTIAGRLVYGSILSGAYNDEQSFGPIPLSDPCPACNGDRSLTYADQVVRVECDSCDISPSAGVPPGVFREYPVEEVPAVANRYFRTIVRQVGNGFCWYCEGQTTPAVVTMDELVGDDLEYPGNGAQLPVVKYHCGRCTSSLTVNLGNSLLAHPAVVAFYYDHGINVQETPLWEFATWDPKRTTVDEREPFRARVSYHAGGDRLEVTVDREHSVIDVERLTA